MIILNKNKSQPLILLRLVKLSTLLIVETLVTTIGFHSVKKKTIEKA